MTAPSLLRPPSSPFFLKVPAPSKNMAAEYLADGHQAYILYLIDVFPVWELGLELARSGNMG